MRRVFFVISFSMFFLASCGQAPSDFEPNTEAAVKTTKTLSVENGKLFVTSKTGEKIEKSDVTPDHWKLYPAGKALTAYQCKRASNPDDMGGIVSREIIEQNETVALLRTTATRCGGDGIDGGLLHYVYDYFDKGSKVIDEGVISGYVAKGYGLGTWENAKESKVYLKEKSIIVEIPFRRLDDCGEFPYFAGPDKSWSVRGYTCFLTEKAYKKKYPHTQSQFQDGAKVITEPVWPKPGILQIELPRKFGYQGHCYYGR